MTGRLLRIKTPQQGRGDTISLARPEGPYMQIHRELRQKPNPFGEYGEWIEDVALHLYLATQKLITRVHCQSHNNNNKSESTGTRK